MDMIKVIYRCLSHSSSTILRQASHISGSDQKRRLCAVCQSLDLSPSTFAVQPDTDTDDDSSDNGACATPHPLGYLDEIRQKTSYCPLCRLIVEAIFGGLGADMEAGPDGDRVRCDIEWKHNGIVSSRAGWQTRYLHVNASPWPLGFNLMNRISPLARDVPGQRPLFFGRLVRDAQVDFRLVRKWLRMCEMHHDHGGDSGAPGAVDTQMQDQDPRSLPFFRLIDVKRWCIVPAPRTCKYYALSYVWGRVENFTARRENVALLERRGGLRQVKNKIPATIKDAMKLVDKLGGRYLWVDSLCITQDDAQYKAAAIASMDLVYSSADATIVAATGDSADAGLPGVRRHSRGVKQTVEKIGRGLRLVVPHHLMDYMEQSTYEGRAWTYQERLFSKRVLIFAKGQAMFRCPHATWREDVVAEDPDITFSLDTMESGAYESTRVDTEFAPHNEYMGALYQYSRRRITYTSDALNAFAAVSKLIASKLEGKTCFGLPNSIFDWALLWEPSQNLVRNPDFPSWSWAGWSGGLEMPSYEFTAEDLQHWLSTRTWVVWYQRQTGCHETILVWSPSDHLRDQNQTRSTTVPGYRRTEESDVYGRPHIKQVPQRFSECSIAPSIAPTVPVTHRGYTDTTSLEPSGSGLLQFRTISAVFRLSSQEVEFPRPVPGLCYAGLFDRNGVLSGTMWLDDSWRDKPSANFEFIVISEGRDSRLTPEFYEEAVAKVNNGRSKSMAGYDSDLVQCDEDVAQGNDGVELVDSDPVDSWNLYHVMLIEWHGGVAERVGVGKLFKTALKHAFAPGPLLKEIILG
ncbi:heterokaryon incompatibility protein-domain-containing protein [Geopyxis carbonaria]|nr:heterokaryon incompatibility protein-domain-containing protein [Geopyxis carbonaria]